MTRVVFISFFAILFTLNHASADDWPQFMGPKRDGVWRETDIIKDFSDGAPVVSWRAEVAGGYSGPAVADGRVFLTDYVLEKGDATPSPNKRNQLKGTERILCFDEKTGKQLWKHDYPRTYEISYPAGPRATPTVDGDRVYTLGAEGDLLCLSVERGTVVWQRNLPDEYETETPIWGFAAHPLIDGSKLICLAGGDGSAAIALDKLTGKEVWRSLTTPDIGYAPPTLIEAGGTRQLLIWHSKSLNSLNPDTGKPFWSIPLEPDYNMSIAPPLKIGDYVYVGAIKDKSMVVKLDSHEPTASVVWRGKNKVGVGPSHCPIVPDLKDPNYVYGVDRGGLRCVEMKTGKHVWEHFRLMESGRRANAGTIFIHQVGDRHFLLSETGVLAIAKLSPDGYEELGRTKPLLNATHAAFGRNVLWSPPAFANGAMFIRNDNELIRVSLQAK